MSGPNEAVTGSKQIFVFIFLTFEKDTTIYRGTLVENVKKVKIQPTLLGRPADEFG
jgi:hypothetical protein